MSSLQRAPPHSWLYLATVLLSVGSLLGSSVGPTELSHRHDPTPIIYPGQVNIGVVANLHAAPGANTTTACGPLRQEAVQRVMAAVWAAHQVNFRKENPQEFNIGVYIFDTCGRQEVAQRQIYRLLSHAGHVQSAACSEKRIPPLFAVITEGDTESLHIPSKLLDAFGIPVITTSGPPIIDPTSTADNYLSTAPTNAALARAAVTVLRQLRLLEVAVVAEDSPPSTLFSDFSREAEISGMQALPVDHPSVVAGDPDNFLASLHLVSQYGKSRLKAVVFLVNPDQALDLLRSVDARNFPQMPWVVITSKDLSPVLLSTFKRHQLRRLQQVLLLSPESSDIPEFQDYFRLLLREDTIRYHPLLVEFARDVSGNITTGMDDLMPGRAWRSGSRRLKTATSNSVINSTIPTDNNNMNTTLNDEIVHETTDPSPITYKEADVSSMVKAVWTLAAALKTVQQRSCRRGTDCLLYLRRSISSYVLKAAKSLDYVLDSSSGSSSLEGNRLKFSEDGTLNSVRFSLKGFTFRGDIQEVGWYSDEAGLAVDHDVISPFNGFVFKEVDPPNAQPTTATPELLSKYKLRPDKVLARPTHSPTTIDNNESNVTSKTTESRSDLGINPPRTLPLEEDDYVNWRILDDTSMTLGPLMDIDTTLGLIEDGVPQQIEAQNEDPHMELVSDNNHDNTNHVFLGHNRDAQESAPRFNSSLNDEELDFDIVVGPPYRSEQQSSSNLRSISLTSHHEPGINNAFGPDKPNIQPARHSPMFNSDIPISARALDRSSSGVAPPSVTEDVKVVTASRNLHMSAWLARPWALTVLGICAFGILVTLYVLVFLMVKACEGSLKKNNSSVAVAQLISILALYVAAGLFTWKPSPLLCGLQRLVPNVSYAFCFGCLLLKGMHLQAQNSLGLGGSVNRINQLLTLLFIVGVQVALETQWWFVKPPSMIFETLECTITKEEILESQGYVSFLLLLSVIVALSTRKIPYNYQEGRSLIATSLTCLIIFLAWDIACWLLPYSSSRNIAAPSALIITAITVLAGIFGPQLFAIHKYGGFPHKPLSYADSLSTVFTMFKDLDNASSSGTTGRGKKTAKTLETPFGGEVGEGTRNPLYSDYQSAYP